MRWTLRHPEPPTESDAGEPIPRLIRWLLRGRGLETPEEVARFLDPSSEERHDPLLLPDLGQAAERIDAALTRRERIFLFGDYDVDGISSLALLVSTLRRFDGQTRTRVPNRLTERYGLSIEAVEEAEQWGARLIITADSGTSAHEEIAFARSKGIDVVVADHHQPGQELPQATALVNPWRSDSTYPFADLAAAGVVTKLMEQLCRIRSNGSGESGSIDDLLDLTALGTVADSVSLRGENRLFVRRGIEQLRKDPRPGLYRLITASRLDLNRMTSTDLAFQIVPRLNAAGRLGEADRSLELLLEEDPVRCQGLVAVLDRQNEKRKALLDRVIRDAADDEEILQRSESGEPLVLLSERWHPGVLGIAAARLAERYDVPTILLASDGELARGSGRTARGCDLLELVEKASEPLRTFGGHRSAVGLTLSHGSWQRFRDRILEEASRTPGLVGPREKTLSVDAVANLGELDSGLMGWLDRLEPFGRGNREPIFAVQGHVGSNLRILKEHHMRFDLLDRGGIRRECIAFNMSKRARELESVGGPVHVAAVVSRNVFRGEERLQLRVKDFSIEDPFRHD